MGARLVDQEEALDLGRTHNPCAQQASKVSGLWVLSTAFTGVKTGEHALQLVLGAESHLNTVVDTTRANQRGIESEMRRKDVKVINL